MPALLRLPDAEVYYRVWPVTQPRAVVLLVHGLGAHSARFEPLCQALNARRIACYAIELQGFGERAQPPGYVASFRQYDEAVTTLARNLLAQHPRVKLFLAGDSMGGLIAFNLAAKAAIPYAGLILLSPAFESILKFPLATYGVVFASLLFDPKRTVTLPFNSAMCTRDPVMQKQMDADPRELRIASAGLLIQILLESAQSARRAKTVQLPLVAFTAGCDQFVNVAVTQARIKAAASRDKTEFHYPEALHALYVDLERERLFRDLNAWLDPRI